MAALPIRLSSTSAGIIKGADIQPSSIEECNRLLEKNHEEWHVFFRDMGGHNHIAHHLLTVLALGASPQELQAHYNEGVKIQRDMPEIDKALLEQLLDPEILYNAIGQIKQYHTFLKFFEREIAAKGWKEVMQEYLFAHTKASDMMLSHLFEGAYRRFKLPP